MTNSGVAIYSVEIAATDGIIDAWWQHPLGSGPWPAVILHTDIKGVRPAFQEIGRKLAALGYGVLLPNLYYRAIRIADIDPSLSLHDGPQRARLATLRETVTTEGTQRDHVALLDWLTTRPEVSGRTLAIIGYCMSGAITLRTAGDFSDRIAAVASFHGGRLASDENDSPHLRAPQIRARLYFGYAKEDKSMSDERIAQLETALSAAGVSFTSDHYDALHGFAVSDKPEYDVTATAQHWTRLHRLLHDTFEAS